MDGRVIVGFSSSSRDRGGGFERKTVSQLHSFHSLKSSVARSVVVQKARTLLVVCAVNNTTDTINCNEQNNNNKHAT